MRPSSLLLAAALSVAPTLSVAPALAQAPAPEAAQAPQPPANRDGFTQDETMRIVQQIRHKLLSLPDYAVFDSLSFGIKGRTIVLEGYASRPILKDEAKGAIKGIEGVETVDNQIKVLPWSSNDDRIRIGVYTRIYTQPALRKYTGSPVGMGNFPSVARAAGGITADPPMGYHAIHIIVENGHVILAGVVDSKQDAEIAYLQANSTPGTFAVKNELIVAGPQPKSKE